MNQLNFHLGAALKQEKYEYKLATSASLVGSRGDQDIINAALKG